VDDIAFTIEPGRTLGVVGESGCGKTTTAKLVLRLEKPTAGQILFQDQDVAGLEGEGLHFYRKSVQAVFQDPYASLNPRMRVDAIIAEPLVTHERLDGPAVAARVAKLLDVVGLPARSRDLFPHEFSGGQRQRIAIARALAISPRLVVLDEPVSALDVSIQAQVLNLLSDLQDDFGLSYLFIAHDLSVVKHVSDAVVVMYLGRVAEQGLKDSVYGTPRHPYSVALLSAAPAADPESAAARQRVILTGDVPSPINPPSGCRFHPRCPKARELCSEQEPALESKAGDPQDHLTACHFPVETGEHMAAASRGETR
jgi:oligopeptide/dipeptide ABC transporter ATP-binding protein